MCELACRKLLVIRNVHWKPLELAWISFQSQKFFSFLGDAEIGSVGRKLKSARDGNCSFRL